MRILFFLGIFCLSVLLCNAQISVTTNSNTATLVNEFLSDGITLSGTPTKYCNSNGTGLFSNGHSTSCPLDSGIILSTGYASFLDRTATYTASAGLNYGSTDPDLYSLNPQFNTDICYLEFSFVPAYDSLVFEYVFGSEEYLEWVGSIFNDVFGFFVTGPNPAGGTYNKFNLATVPSSSDIVSINSINNISNTSYYINNYPTGTDPGIDDPNFTLDGFTRRMEIGLAVVPLATYTIKMVVGDVSDPLWDSYVLLHSKSFRSISNSALAIELRSFEAELNEDEVLLEWETATEENHREFIVEHSKDALVWESLGSIEGALNSNTNLSYSFTHSNPLTGSNYYRLGLLDTDGTMTYSKVISVNNKSSIEEVIIYPNVISDGNLQVQLTELNGGYNADLEIYNLLGERVLYRKIVGKSTTVNLNGLNKGTYIANLDAPEYHKVFRFIIQ